MLQSLLEGLLLPLVTALAGFALTRRRGADPKAPRGCWGGALAVGGGYLVGHTAVRGWPPWPPLERLDWLWYLTPVAVALGLVETLAPLPAGLRWVLRTLLWVTVVDILVAPWRMTESSPAALAAGLLALRAGGLVCWGTVAALAGRGSGRGLPPLLVVLALGSALVLFWSGSLVLAQLAGALGACLAAAALAAWWTRTPLAQGGGSVAAVLVLGIWLVGYFTLDVPAASAVLLPVGVPLAWLAGAVAARLRLRPWLVAVVEAVCVVLPVALAVLAAWRAAPSDPYS
jgi:hypothetical protein